MKLKNIHYCPKNPLDSRTNSSARTLEKEVGSASWRFRQKRIFSAPAQKTKKIEVVVACQMKNMLFSMLGHSLKNLSSIEAADDIEDDPTDNDDEDIADAGDCPSVTASW